MARILVYSRNRLAAERLAASGVFPVEIEVVSSPQDLAHPAADIIGVIVDAEDEEVPGHIFRLRKELPDRPIIVWCERTPSALATLSQLARAGVSAIIFRDTGSLQHPMLAAIIASDDLDLEVLIGQTLQRRVPVALTPLVRFCVTPREGKLTVADVAKAFEMPQRSLAHRLRKAGLPPTHALVEWGKLLSAAWAVCQSKESVERIALRYGFSSPGRFRFLLRQRGLTTPIELRQRRGFNWLLRCFDHALAVAGRKP